MPTWLSILLGFLGSAGVFSFLEFLIKRHDTRKGTTSQIMSELRGQIMSELRGMRDEIKALRDDVEKDKAVDARRRILQFSDSLIHDERRHSKEFFDQVMDDITDYEKYCDAHKDFKNNKADASIAHIKKTYSERLEDKEFL